MDLVPLPRGYRTPAEWRKAVIATQPHGYADSVATVCAYLDGAWRGDTENALARVFPVTWRQMTPLGLNLMERISEAKALVYDGTPTLTATTTDGEALPPTQSGMTFARVLEEANLRDVLMRVDERTVAARLVFVRVAWDAIDERVRLDIFDAQAAWPLYDPDRPSLATSPGVLLKLAKAGDSERYELWTSVTDVETGETTDARNLIVSDAGEVLAIPGDDEANPYRGPDGVPDGAGAPDGRYPVLPVVAFGDTQAAAWPYPRQSLVDAQRAANVRETNLGHVALLQAHGQWLDTRNDANAQDWGGASVRGTERERLARGYVPPAGTQIPMGPDTVVSVPFGHTLANVPIAAQLSELRQDRESFLRTVCVSEGIPAGTLVDSARTMSGVALTVERAPLARYREKRIAALSRATRDLIDLVRVVWNTHHDAAERFVADGGVRAVFVPDDMRTMEDPREAVELAERRQRLGIYSRTELRADLDGVDRDQAAKLLADRDAEEAPREASQRSARLGMFPLSDALPSTDEPAE